MNKTWVKNNCYYYKKRIKLENIILKKGTLNYAIVKKKIDTIIYTILYYNFTLERKSKFHENYIIEFNIFSYCFF